MKLPWLRDTWQQITRSNAQGRLGHALGLCHKPALGSPRLLETLINWLLCQAADKTTQPCKQCKSCQLFRAGNHPDFSLLKPEPNRTLGVDEVRSLQNRLAQSPHQSGVKVAVIEQAERMTLNAANALLKTLEEPPGDTYIILTASRFDDLLPTVRSRLQIYRLSCPGVTSLAAWLSQYSNTTVSPSATLQAWCDRPLDALERLNRAVAVEQAVSPADALDCTKDAEHWIRKAQIEPVKETEQALQLLDQAERWLIEQYSRALANNQENGDLPAVLSELRRIRQELRGRSGLNNTLAIQHMLSQLQRLSRTVTAE